MQSGWVKALKAGARDVRHMSESFVVRIGYFKKVMKASKAYSENIDY